MHDSMVRLYKIAFDKKGVAGQSALARELNESPQTVKNWEVRGISKMGALKAQEVFGCDANWLQGAVNWARRTREQKDASGLVAEEPKRPWGWPFKTVSFDQYSQLSPEERDKIDTTVAAMVAGIIALKQLPPEKKSGAS